MEYIDAVSSRSAVSPAETSGTPEETSQDVIRGATDARTGAVDTRHLAGLVADAAQQNFATASNAYTQLEAQLSKSDPAAAGHFSRDVTAAFAAQAPAAPSSSSSPTALTGPLWGVGKGVTQAGRGVLQNNPILQVQWATTPNAANKVGFTPGLQSLLESKGIQTSQYPRVSGLNPSNEPRYRTANGAVARDAIADRFRAQGYSVNTEVTEQTPFKTPKVPTGERHVDVSAVKPGPTPETGSRVDVESKLGRTGLDSDIRLQVAKDAWRVEQNQSIRVLGRSLEVGGKVLKPLGLVLDGVQVGVAIHDDGNQFGPQAQRATAGIVGGAVGGWAGAEAGATAGAAIGTLIAPGIGTAVGGVVGGLLGGFGGGWFGSSAATAAYDAATR